MSEKRIVVVEAGGGSECKLMDNNTCLLDG
jgi:hypothetical protein